MANCIDMDTNAQSFAYPQDFQIEGQPSAIWRRLLTRAVLYIFIISYGDTDDYIFMDNGGK